MTKKKYKHLKLRWRRIVKRDHYKHPGCPRLGNSSVLLYLECGHYTHRKASKEPKGDVIRCKECEGQFHVPF